MVDAITAQGGVRSQPSREMTAAFLGSIARLDAVAVGGALEMRLGAHSWQVKLKAMCVLDAVLRNEGDAVCDTICAFFQEDATAVMECTESPQASLREKAKRVRGSHNKTTEGCCSRAQQAHVDEALWLVGR